MLKYNFLILIFSVFTICRAQTSPDVYQYIPKFDPPKSPNAGTFEQYTSLPGNYQTGQVSPSIDLMNFTIDGLMVPLTLNYSNTGLKVMDVASWVGLGWNLDAGGTITREVKGIPDDSDLGLMDPTHADIQQRVIRNEITGIARWNYFNDIVKDYADTEHDIFTYSILGISGRFYIDKFGKCIQMPNSNNKITFTKKSNKQLDAFTITDERGNNYVFSIKEESIITGVTPTSYQYFNKLIGNTWYIKEIQTKNGEKIIFDYDHYQYSSKQITESVPFVPVSEAVSHPDCLNVNGSYQQTEITTLINVYQPNRITWKNGYILFTTGATRTDLKEIDANATVPSLAGLSMYETPAAFSSAQGSLIKKIAFNYQDGARLFLKMVNLDQSNLNNNYQFTYVNESLQYPSYKFLKWGYKAQDYWGYFNGATGNSGLLPYDAMSSQPAIDGSPQGNTRINLADFTKKNNRASNPAFATYGMLQDITYPTGGMTRFYYEGNTVRKDMILSLGWSTESMTLINTLIQTKDSQNNPLVTLGGVRIKKLEFYNSINDPSPALITNISYDLSNVYVGFIPFFYSYVYRKFSNCNNCVANYLFTLHSSSVLSSPAPIVQYNNVSELNEPNARAGKTTHHFSFSRFGPGHFSVAPFLTPIYQDWLSQQKSLSYHVQDGRIVKLSNTEMDSNNPSLSSIDARFNQYGYDLKVMLVRNDNCIGATDIYVRYSTGVSPSTDAQADDMVNQMFKWESIELTSENYVTKRQVDSTYNKGQVPIGINNTYHYNNQQKNLLLPNSISTIDSKGDSILTLISYPQDYFSVPISPGYTSSDGKVNGLIHLINKNILAIPVEKINIIKRAGVRYVTSATLSVFNPDKPSLSAIYSLPLNAAVPLSSFTKSSISSSGNLLFDSRYQKERQFLNYNSVNQPLEFEDKFNGVRHSLLWDYNSTYQIAEVVNGSQADIAYTSFEAEGKGNWAVSSSSRNTGGLSGRKSYPLSSSNTLSKSGLTTSKQYVISYWTTGSKALIIAGTLSGYPIKGTTLNGWTYYEHVVSGLGSVLLKSTETVSIDEVRLYPRDSQMTTFTYRPLTGITSSVDAKNQITYYEYDDMLRLTGVKDQDGNVIQRTDYHYQEK